MRYILDYKTFESEIGWCYDQDVNWMLTERFEFVPYAIFSMH